MTFHFQLLECESKWCHIDQILRLVCVKEMFKRKPHCEPARFALSGFQCDSRQVNLQCKPPQQVCAINAPTTLPKGSKFLQILHCLMVKKSNPSMSASAIRFAIFVHLSLQPSVVRFQSACTGSAAVAKAINDFVWSCECCVCCQLFQPEKKQNLWHTALTALVNCF